MSTIDSFQQNWSVLEVVKQAWASNTKSIYRGVFKMPKFTLLFNILNTASYKIHIRIETLGTLRSTTRQARGRGLQSKSILNEKQREWIICSPKSILNIIPRSVNNATLSIFTSSERRELAERWELFHNVDFILDWRFWRPRRRPCRVVDRKVPLINPGHTAHDNDTKKIARLVNSC